MKSYHRLLMQTLPVIVALACYSIGVAAQISESLSTVFSIPSTVIASSVSTATLIASTTSTSTPSPSFSFPPPGSITRDYSPNGLEELWDIVGLFPKSPRLTLHLAGRTSRSATVYHHARSISCSHATIFSSRSISVLLRARAQRHTPRLEIPSGISLWRCDCRVPSRRCRER